MPNWKSRISGAGLLLILSVFVAQSMPALASSTSPSIQDQINQVIAAHGGTQISPNQVAWNDGAVILTIPSSQAATPTPSPKAQAAAVAPAIRSNCPTSGGWFCFFQDINYGGRMLQFRDCFTQYFANYGFAGQASSWDNPSNERNLNVFSSAPPYSFYLWSETHNSRSSWVGSANNDRADYFDCWLS